MPTVRLSIPVRGVSDTRAFIDQAGDTNPPEVLRNFRVNDALTDRASGGTRPTLRRLFDAPLGNGPVQGLVKVNRPSVSTGYTLGDSTVLASGGDNAQTTLVGNHWGLDSVPSLEWAATLESTAVVPPPSPGVNANCLTPDGLTEIVAGSAKNGAYLELKVRGINPETGATLWTYTFSDGANDWYVTAVCATNDWAFVFTRNEIHVLWLRDPFTGAGYKGTRAQRSDCNGWSDVTIGGGVHSVTSFGGGFQTGTTTTYLTVGFYGASRAGTIVGGTLDSGETLGTAIDLGIYASHFRSGVMRFRVLPLPTTSPFTPTPTVITQVSFGIQLAASDPRYETSHGYYRVSEQSRNSPQGCYITDIDVAADGSVLFSRTNQGWGPTPDLQFRPSGRTSRPFIALCKINADGSTAWEMDPGSIIGGGTGSGYYLGNPHYNDINDPTFTACCFGKSGECWIGGKQTVAGFSVYRVSAQGGTDGGQNVMDATRAVRKEAMRIDPSDGNLIVGGDRNTGWEGAAGAQAHLWKINATTLEIVWSWDLDEAVSALAVAIQSTGRILYGTDYVS